MRHDKPHINRMNSAGTSLIELCFALALIGLLLAISPLTHIAPSTSAKKSIKELEQAVARIEREAVLSGHKIWLIYNPSCHCLEKVIENSNNISLVKLATSTQITINSAYRYNQAPALLFTQNNFSSPASIVLNSNEANCILRQSILGARYVTCS